MDNHNDICSIALDEAIGMCDDKSAVFKKMAVVAGISPGDFSVIRGIENTYAGVVASGIPVGADDMSLDARKWVLAKAWELTTDNSNMDIFSAFEIAWEEAREMIVENSNVGDSTEYEDIEEYDDFPDDSSESGL